jgi:hypothetical protein
VNDRRLPYVSAVVCPGSCLDKLQSADGSLLARSYTTTLVGVPVPTSVCAHLIEDEEVGSDESEDHSLLITSPWLLPFCSTVECFSVTSLMV